MRRLSYVNDTFPRRYPDALGDLTQIDGVSGAVIV